MENQNKSLPKSSSRLTDLDGVRVGHWSDHSAKTGCTVVMFDKANSASAHVAGGAPGSSETDLLDPSCLVEGVNAIMLSGGSAFGLEASAGVRRYLEKKGRGFNAQGHLVPIVPSAVIFDLANGDGSVRPGPEEGFLACVDAENKNVIEGNVGAGAGARVGKYMGAQHGADGGLASRSVTTADGVFIGAMMVANCYGAIVDPDTGKTVAGPKTAGGGGMDYLLSTPPKVEFGATAIGVVVTNAKFAKSDLKRIAIMAHDGLARCVYPCHTPYDGDLIFAVSMGDKEWEVARAGAWAAKLVERCVVEAVSLGE